MRAIKMRARMTFVTAAILGRREGREEGIRGGIVDVALRAPFCLRLCVVSVGLSFRITFQFFFFPPLWYVHVLSVTPGRDK